MSPSGKYLVATAGAAKEKEIQAAVAGLRWIEAQLSGTSDMAADQPPNVWVGLDGETGTRWVAVLAVNPEGLSAAQLRALGIYGREALEYVRLSDKPVEKPVDPETLERMVMEYRPPQRVTLDAHFLLWVSAYYDVALRLAGERPTSWMAERLGRSTTTVDRWIEAARRNGFIGQDVGRRRKRRKGGST